MNKIPTIIYGGSFNPPTIAHQKILKACSDYVADIDKLGEVWIIPSGNRRDKTINTVRSIRVEYINALISDAIKSGAVDNFHLIETELDRKIYVETYDTAMRLEADFPDRDFYWVYGADSIETMHLWQHGDWLLDNLKMILVERRGSRIHPLAKNVVRLEVSGIDGISSTDVRSRISAGLSIDNIVGKSVLAVIKRNKIHLAN